VDAAGSSATCRWVLTTTAWYMFFLHYLLRPASGDFIWMDLPIVFGSLPSDFSFFLQAQLARATASFTATAALISQSKGQCGRGMLACCNLQLARS